MLHLPWRGRPCALRPGPPCGLQPEPWQPTRPEQRRERQHRPPSAWRLPQRHGLQPRPWRWRPPAPMRERQLPPQPAKQPELQQPKQPAIGRGIGLRQPHEKRRRWRHGHSSSEPLAKPCGLRPAPWRRHWPSSRPERQREKRHRQRCAKQPATWPALQPEARPWMRHWRRLSKPQHTSTVPEPTKQPGSRRVKQPVPKPWTPHRWRHGRQPARPSWRRLPLRQRRQPGSARARRHRWQLGQQLATNSAMLLRIPRRRPRRLTYATQPGTPFPTGPRFPGRSRSASSARCCCHPARRRHPTPVSPDSGGRARWCRPSHRSSADNIVRPTAHRLRLPQRRRRSTASACSEFACSFHAPFRLMGRWGWGVWGSMKLITPNAC